jgi:spectrin beta
LHQLLFDIDCELQWIAEKRPLAAHVPPPDTLTQALNAHKKHEQFEAEVQGHQTQIDAIHKEARDLIKSQHFANDQISVKDDQLTSAWAELLALTASKRALLNVARKAQQYLFDADEIRTWMADLRALLSVDDYGQDEAAAAKLLARHRGQQADMSAYRTWMANLALACDDLCEQTGVDGQRFRARQSDLEQQFKELEELAQVRRKNLEDACALYQYLRESQELESWINEQLQTAMSEEYGHDYEHLAVGLRFDHIYNFLLFLFITF